jgi:Sulfotransferase family
VIRFLEKTPKNTLRIPMLTRLFPDALYVWLKRSAAANIDSLIAGWHAEDKFGPLSRQRYGQAGYPIAAQLELLDYRGKWWKFALVPGWRNLKGKTVADVATWQYYQCNRYLLDDLTGVDRRKVFSVRYEDLVRTPTEVIRWIFEWADLPPSRVAEEFARVLPRVNAVSPAAPRSINGLRYPDTVFGAIERLPAIGLLQRMMGYEAETI